MPSIIHKIQALNRLQAIQVRCTFSERNNPFIGRPSRKALHKRIFRFDSIENHTGWKESDLEASFPSYLLKFSHNLVDTPNIESVIALDETLRVCNECFIKGYHLMIHQCLDFEKCPIHMTVLTNRCPFCGEELGEYGVEFNIQKGFTCTSCQWGLLGESFGYDIALQKNKKKIMNEYSKWSAAVSGVISGNSMKRLSSLTPAENFSQISIYHQLLGGPSWIKKCLFSNADSRMHKTFSYKIAKSPPLVQREESKQTSLNKNRKSKTGSKYLKRLHLEKLLRQNLRLSFEELERDVNKHFPWVSECDNEPDSLAGNNVSFSLHGKEGASQALKVLHIEVMSYLTNPDVPFYTLDFWKQWEQGPGSLLASTKNNAVASTIASTEWLLEASDIWFRSMLRTIYKTVLLRSYFSGSNRQYVFELGTLSKLSRELGCNSVYATKGSNLIEISPLANLDGFRTTINRKSDTEKLYMDECQFADNLTKLITCSARQKNYLLNQYTNSSIVGSN